MVLPVEVQETMTNGAELDSKYWEDEAAHQFFHSSTNLEISAEKPRNWQDRLPSWIKKLIGKVRSDQ